jgi:hypothetical protein
VSPLVSGTVPDNAAAPLVTGFRYITTAPATLTAGHNYVIAALYPHTWDQTTDAINNPGFVLTVDPAIGFGGYQWSSSGVLAFPENYIPGNQSAFGPNFVFTVIPEPSTSTLCVLICAALLGSAKSRFSGTD